MFILNLNFNFIFGLTFTFSLGTETVSDDLNFTSLEILAKQYNPKMLTVEEGKKYDVMERDGRREEEK